MCERIASIGKSSPKGTLTELLMHPREVFHLAIRHKAHSLILAHNHPSGDPTPSTRDLHMTRLLLAVGKVVGIELADHLIIGQGRYVSLFQQRSLTGKGTPINSSTKGF